MKWGTFSLSQMPEVERAADIFATDFGQFELAEELGFDTIWLAEHLFSNYGIVTSTQVIAAAVAERTKNIKIGSAVVVIPFNHPLRTASDFALVDILSGGRLLFGVGRAYQPHEFTGLGVPIEKSREMYAEGLDIVLKAWTEDRISFEGEFWQIPDPVEMLPKPLQKPHPPVYQACVSPESFETAAEKGFNIQMAAPFTYRTYREEWIDRLADSLASYEKACRKYGKDPKTSERMLLIPFFVDEDGDKAREILKTHVEWFYNKVSENQLKLGRSEGLIKGYELTMAEGRKTMAEGYLAFEKLLEHGAAIAGNPEECAERLSHMRDKLGITEFVLWTNIGGMSAENSRSAMRLIMERIAPLVDGAKPKALAAE